MKAGLPQPLWSLIFKPAGSGTDDVSGAAAALDALVDGKVIAPGMAPPVRRC